MFGAQVPPSKDSFFLALMKGLQLAGLRPLKYDFSESTVMGSTSQVLHLHPTLSLVDEHASKTPA
jgi:hypothetical protein